MGHWRGCGKSLWGLLTLFTCSLCYLQFCIWLSFEPAFEIQRSTTRRVWSWLQRQRHQQLLEPQDVFFLFGCPAHFDKTPPKKCCVLAGCLSKWCLIRMLQLDRELQLLHGRQSQVLGHHPAVAVMRRNMLWCFCISLKILSSNPPNSTGQRWSKRGQSWDCKGIWEAEAVQLFNSIVHLFV